MSSFQAWQKQFALSILNRENHLQHFSSAGQLNETEALNVYRQGYVARLTEALGECFESVWGVLGDADFFAGCSEFIQQEVSQSYNINDYKITFIDFIGRKYHKEFPFLRDLAAMDWYYRELFHQKTQTGMGPQDLSDKLQNIEVQRAHLVESMKVIFSNFDLSSIWQGARKNDLHNIDFQAGHFCILMNKTDSAIYIGNIAFKVGRALQKLMQGESLTDTVADLESDEIAELFKVIAQHRLALRLQ